MPRDYKVQLEDMLQAARKIQQYTAQLSFDDFSGDSKTVDAVIRNLEVIGEAAKAIPEPVRAEIPLEWRRIAGLRDILIHQYFGIDLPIVWEVVTGKVPELIEAVEHYLSHSS